MGNRLFSTAIIGLIFGATVQWVSAPPALTPPMHQDVYEQFYFRVDTWDPPVQKPASQTPEPIEGDRSCPTFEPLFREYGLKPVKTFSYIAWRESRCRPDAVNARWDAQGNIVWTLNKNGSYDSGLLQINSSWRTVTRNICGGGIDLLTEVDCNLRVAKYLLDNGGLGHWRASLD
jgi:hypothetical protein